MIQCYERSNMSKFAPTEQNFQEVIEKLNTEQKKCDAYKLVELFQKVSGEFPVVWHPGIIGFGQYRYKYESGRKGDSPLLAFAPRKAKISLYIDQDLPNREEYLNRLGKHKRAVSCVYVNKLADIDVKVLEEILVNSLKHTLTKPHNMKTTE